MKCPRCDGKLKVISTRHSDRVKDAHDIPNRFYGLEYDFIYRRRKCSDCDELSHSIEKIHPIIECKVYIEKGCSHFDINNCDVRTCSILNKKGDKND